ncbi:MAG: DUF1073 domain-containing protein [Elusimicrobiota bacterium]|jgi:hypothetical protein|nr:DUF1073 domain-containing protein [Elusimicrobiota bacterium]
MDFNVGNFVNNFVNKIISQPTDTGLENIFKLEEDKENFKKNYAIEIYKRLLTDCYYKSVGLAENTENSFWDSYLATEANKGLITLLAEAMYAKTKLYLIYIRNENIVRIATADEQKQIDNDIKNKGKSKIGIVCSFENFYKTNLLKMYLDLIYTTISGINTGINLTQAIILKIGDLRQNISSNDRLDPISQAKKINTGMKEGKSVMLDAKDNIELPKYDVGPTEQSLKLFNSFIANLLGMPLSYVNGELTQGLSTTGESDQLAINRGLAYYFNSIFKPIVDNLMGLKIKFMIENWRKLEAVSNLLPILETSEIVSDEYKKIFIDEVFK